MSATSRFESLGGGLITVAVASLLGACASTAVRPTGAAGARARLTQLQSDPALANRAPLAMHAADAAVRVAERPDADSDLEAYRVYMAERKIDTARAEAETRLEEDERPALRAEREQARLDARTRELDLARNRAAAADAEGAEQAAAAGLAPATPQRPVAPGLVVTLQDPVFLDDGAVSEDSSSGNLNRVVAFLEQFPDRTATIEGFSDDSGTDESEQIRSQRRADSVMSYLIRRGIDPNRLMALGMGDSWPVANNDSAAGRHQNRRVEVAVQATGPRLRQPARLSCRKPYC